MLTKTIPGVLSTCNHPNQLGVDYILHVLEAFAEHVALALGWKPNTDGPVLGTRRYPDRMSYSLNGSSNDSRVAALRKEQQQRMTRFFMAFALIEGVLLAAGVVAVYLLELIDPEQGIWLLVVIGVLGAVVLSGSLLSMTRRHAREMRELTGY